jgi:hypothetical protein
MLCFDLLYSTNIYAFIDILIYGVAYWILKSFGNMIY